MAIKNRIEDLRNHLFETLEALKDDEKPMDLDRARAVADVARVIVDSAKVEVEFAKVTNEATGEFPGSSFLPAPPKDDTPQPLTAVGGRRTR
jgi:hypothetical protein